MKLALHLPEKKPEIFKLDKPERLNSGQNISQNFSFNSKLNILLEILA